MKLPEIKTYWIAWLVIVAGLFLLKWIVMRLGFTTIAGWIGLGYLAFIWIPIMFLNHFEQQPLLLRLKELRRTNTEREISFASWALVRSVFTNETLGDAEVARLRRRYVSFVRFVLFAFLAFPPALALLS